MIYQILMKYIDKYKNNIIKFFKVIITYSKISKTERVY